MPHEQTRKKASTTARSRRTHSGEAEKRSRSQRRGKIRSRAGARRYSTGTMGDVRKKHPLIRLLEAIEAEKIRYTVIGMSAAIAQGVMANTLDVDLWIDLPSREYIRLLNLSRRLGATIAANTVVYLEDGTPVNFVYEVTGLGSFSREWKYVARAQIYDHMVPVLRLERIVKSKEAVGRDKDKLHILHIRDFLRCKSSLKKKCC